MVRYGFSYPHFHLLQRMLFLQWVLETAAICLILYDFQTMPIGLLERARKEKNSWTEVLRRQGW